MNTYKLMVRPLNGKATCLRTDMSTDEVREFLSLFKQHSFSTLTASSHYIFFFAEAEQ